jgi:hypothetical protein
VVLFAVLSQTPRLTDALHTDTGDRVLQAAAGDSREPSTPWPGFEAALHAGAREATQPLHAGTPTTSAAPILAVVSAPRPPPAAGRRCKTPGSARCLAAGRGHSTQAARRLPLPAAALPARPAVRHPLPERCQSLHGRAREMRPPSTQSRRRH